MWEFTPEESDVYLHLRFREIIFRESILAMFSGKSTTKSKSLKEDPEGAYCEACRAKKKLHPEMNLNCDACTRDIKVLNDRKK